MGLRQLEVFERLVARIGVAVVTAVLAVQATPAAWADDTPAVTNASMAVIHVEGMH
jgi:hypothetical protein